MVCLIKNYAPEKTGSGPKNCVGDFFCRDGGFVGKTGLQVVDRAGESELIDKRLRRVSSLSQEKESQDCLNAKATLVAAQNARGAYNGKDGAPGWYKLDSKTLSALGIEPALFNNVDSGFSATMYTDGNNYMLGFRGSEMTYNDWIENNLSQEFGYGGDQYQQAARLSDIAYNRFGDRLSLTGHSLGGGLASAGSTVTGAKTWTFNSAGLHSNTVSDIGGSLSRANVNAYIVRGDILNIYQTLYPLPGAIGQHTWINPSRLTNAIGLHLIEPTIEALEARVEEKCK